MNKTTNCRFPTFFVYNSLMEFLIRLCKTQKAIGVEYIKELEETTIEQMRTLLNKLKAKRSIK